MGKIGMKKVLIISCIVVVALSSIFLVNQWINVNNSKNFMMKFNPELGNKFNKVVEIAIADPEVRERIESLEEGFGNISATVIIEKNGTVEVRFTPDLNPNEAGNKKLHGIICVVDLEAKKVVKVREFDMPPISVPTPPQNPSFWEPKLRLYLNNDGGEFVNEFVQGEKIRIFLENIGNKTITLPNPAPWEVIVLPMTDAEIESKLHCSPEESVYAQFPRIYPDMYNIPNDLIYKPKVEQTAVLIYPNETLTWTWDQRLNDGSLLKPGHYQVVLKGLDVKYVKQTIFYVLPK